MFNRKKFLILLASMVVLGVVLTTPLSNLARFGSVYNQTPSPDATLELKEINAFLVVWSEFMQKDISRSMAQVSLNTEGQIPLQVTRWLNFKGWSAERFFADEQRLRELVVIAELQNSLEANRRLLVKLSGVPADNMKRIINNQELQLKSRRYNSQELALVKANLYQINQVLDGKAVMED